MADFDPIVALPKKYRLLRNIMVSIAIILVVVSIAIVGMFSTDRGSQFLLERVLERQQMIRYQYVGGNLWNGIELKSLELNVAAVEVNIDQAEVSLGWRAILNKEIHLNQAQLGELEIINKKPPSEEDFQFSKIALPFTLRIDHLNVQQLLIKNQNSVTKFYDIDLKDALWADTTLKFADSKMKMDFLSAQNLTGQIQFDEKYPLKVSGKVNLPALHNSLNIHDIEVVATGSLDTIEVGVASYNPDLITGWTVLHPVRKNVPMFGALNFNQYHWPFLKEQELLTEKGIAKFQGNIHGFKIQANTDLSAKDLPKGQYQANMETDFLTQLKIEDLNAQILQGEINLAGVLGWKDYFNWNVTGNLAQLNPQDEFIPQIVRDFLPPQTDAKITTQGNLKQGVTLKAQLDFDQYENWQVDFQQKNNQSTQITAHWQALNRVLPYVGALHSPTGQANINLTQQQQNIQVALNVAPHEKSLVPVGNYQADLKLKQHLLNIQNFVYQDQDKKGSLLGNVDIMLPHQQQQLKWNAHLTAQDFNPQQLVAAAPINKVKGFIRASGFAQKNQHIIQLNQVDLNGYLPQQNENIHLTGKSGLAFFLHEEAQQGGLKSFAINYDGYLDASQFKESKGLLKIRLSGTPKLLNITQLEHQGVLGHISAQGKLNLDQTLGWDIQASLQNFKPQYLFASVQGEVSGHIQTDGIWTEKDKKINIQQLNVTGHINQKPVYATGNLALSLQNNGNSLKPQQFKANQLQLRYAGNTIQATGNEQQLKLNIVADQLGEIYSGLRGKIIGTVDVSLQPRLKLLTHLAIDQLTYKQLVSIKKLRLHGELPTSNVPTVLTASLNYLRSGKHEIQAAELQLAGTRAAHVLSLKGHNRLSKLSIQFAGGLNANNEWIGQAQKGDFNSYRTHLVQQQSASIMLNMSQKKLWMGAHCWKSQQSQICADQAIHVSPQQGHISLVSHNLNLKDFAAFMSSGFILTGTLDGHLKAAWQNSKRPTVNARLITQKGSIGLVGEDPQAISTLNYDKIALVATSVDKGLQVRLDVKTPNIGTGYANVVIDPYQAHKPMQGEIAFYDIQLQVLRPFITDVRRLEGMLSVAAKVNGTLSKPILNGDIRLKDGAISMISLPVNLTNIQLYSAIRQNYASLKGAFNSGQGVGKIQGDIDWRTQPRIRLDLTGEDLYIRQAPLISALISPTVSLNVYPERRRLEVTGKVPVTRALISMPQASASVVNVSSDVRIVREGEDQLAALKVAKPWDIRADIDVELGKQVIFQGFDSRIPLTGRLYLTQRGLETALRANGAIGIANRVKIDAYGQSLDLNRAIARFNGPLYNPTLDVDANKNVQGSLVGFRVVGTATRPNIQIYNDAGLSEQEALNALLTGRINDGTSGISQTEGFKSDVNNTIAAAGISMGLGGTRALTNQIGRTLGLSSLAIDAQGTGDDTQVSLTGYITPDLFLRYGVGVFTPVNKLTLRYQMNKRLYLEASQALERAIDVFYHWRF